MSSCTSHEHRTFLLLHHFNKTFYCFIIIIIIVVAFLLIFHTLPFKNCFIVYISVVLSSFYTADILWTAKEDVRCTEKHVSLQRMWHQILWIFTQRTEKQKRYSGGLLHFWVVIKNITTNKKSLNDKISDGSKCQRRVNTYFTISQFISIVSSSWNSCHTDINKHNLYGFHIQYISFKSSFGVLVHWWR